MAQKIVAGNWKMNLVSGEGLDLIGKIGEYCAKHETSEMEVVVAPPMLYLSKAVEVASSDVQISAQNCHSEESGAFTGEVSADMIREAGAKYVIIGHSERRQIFHEADDFLNAKLKKVLKAGLQPILCVGEKLDDRKQNRQEQVVEQQLNGALKGFSTNDLQGFVIAYEPVWAIGTGETASPEQAQEMHHFIREYLRKKYSDQTADAVSLLYGGSVKPDNAGEIFRKPDVDGGLVGGASLKFDSFAQLIQIGSEVWQ